MSGKRGKSTVSPLSMTEVNATLMDSDHGTTAREDLWNIDLSDLFTMMPPDEPTRQLPGRSSSAREPKRALNTMLHQQSPSLPKIKRSVSFHKVEVRVFERVLGDNPSCSSGGPSLGLGWSYDEEKAVDLETFETNRRAPSLSSWTTMMKNTRKKSLVMSAAKREKVARKFGYTKAEIQKNVEQVQKTQRRRNRTIKELGDQELKELRQEVMTLNLVGSRTA